MTNMPKPEGSFWSDDQWSAISESGEDILVAALAGSGKTAVLVERIIRKIADPSQGYSVDRLLVATFTKAAAAEMKQRIREALERALEEQPGEEHLRSACRRLDGHLLQRRIHSVWKSFAVIISKFR